MVVVNYVDNSELLNEFRKSKQRKEKYPDEGPDKWITPALTRLYMLMVDRVAEHTFWNSYGSNYVMEFKSQALFEFSRYALSFPDDPPHNIFSYYTNMITSAFKRAIKREKTQERVAARLGAQYDVLSETEDELEEDYYEDN